VGVGFRIFKKLQKGYKKALATNSPEIKNPILSKLKIQIYLK
jgi:hypothetical protein